MARDKDSLTLAKIVCFDEGSATDYIQMVNGGDATTVKEKTSGMARFRAMPMRKPV